MVVAPPFLNIRISRLVSPNHLSNYFCSTLAVHNAFHNVRVHIWRAWQWSNNGGIYTCSTTGSGCSIPRTDSSRGDNLYFHWCPTCARYSKAQVPRLRLQRRHAELQPFFWCILKGTARQGDSRVGQPPRPLRIGTLIALVWKHFSARHATDPLSISFLLFRSMFAYSFSFSNQAPYILSLFLSLSNYSVVRAVSRRTWDVLLACQRLTARKHNPLFHSSTPSKGKGIRLVRVIRITPKMKPKQRGGRGFEMLDWLLWSSNLSKDSEVLTFVSSFSTWYLLMMTLFVVCSPPPLSSRPLTYTHTIQHLSFYNWYITNLIVSGVNDSHEGHCARSQDSNKLNLGVANIAFQEYERTRNAVYL